MVSGIRRAATTPDARRSTLAVRVATCLAACFALSLPACKPTGAGVSGQGLVIKNPVGDRPTFYDFGTLAYGERAEHVFRIENTDPVPVTIHDMLASCGCAVPRISYRAADGTEVTGRNGDPAGVITLPSGAVAHVAIAIDTSHVERMNLDKLAQVRLRSDSKNTPYVTLEMHVLVERAFRSVPEKLDLGASPRSAGKSARVDVSVENSTCLAKITGVAAVKGPFEATVDRTEIHGRELWILVVTAKSGLDLGPVYGTVTLATTGMDGTGEGPPFVLPVSAQITPDVVLSPPALQLGTFAKGETRSVRATLSALVPGQRFRIQKSTVDGANAEWMRLTYKPVDADRDGRATEWTVELYAPSSTPEGAFSGSVHLALDHATVPAVDVTYSGVVR